MAKRSKGAGRPRKPDNVKKLQGTYRPDRSSQSQPVFTGTPKCPPWLGERAQIEWKRVAPQLMKLGMLTAVDMAVFAAYCQAFGDYVDLTVEIGNLEALTFKTPKGFMQSVPQVKQRQEAYKQMKECAVHFGFTPASRSTIRIMIDNGETDKPADDGNGTGRQIQLIR